MHKIKIKTGADIELLREGGKRLATILEEISTLVRPGITTAFLNAEAIKRINALGDKPAFLHYRPDGAARPYPAALCTSINEEIVHGLPSERVLEQGDIVSIDLGLNHQGRFTDHAMTVPVGKVSPAILKFMDITNQSLEAGIAAARPGGYVGDIGAAISAIVKKAGYTVVKELAGHGVGLAVHEDPYIPNEGKMGQGMKLEPGMVIAIEPMTTVGKDGHIVLEDDGFTFSTRDGSISAHFEHTVLITDQGPEVLTRI